MKKSKSLAHDERFRSNRASEKLVKDSGIHELVEKLQNTQQMAEMEKADGRVRVASVWLVPDLTLRGYRDPSQSRQYVVTLTKGLSKKQFMERVREAFDS